MTEKTTLVIGASEHATRYSNMCVRQLQQKGIPVVAIGSREGWINRTQILTGFPQLPEIHTITLYINQLNQKSFYDYILQIHPVRVIFNPGTENPELIGMLESHQIEVVNFCTLIMLSKGEF
jgi:predicted CoA-binding protein